MPDPASAPFFHLEIASLQRRFTVVSFSATEAISQPYTIELEILGDGFDLDLTSLMYQPAWLSCGGEQGFPGQCFRGQGFHGQIHGATRKHYQPGPACYTLLMGPRLACLGLRQHSRIFQHMTATRIIAQVLEEHGLRNTFRFDLQTECIERESCVQYQESDLQLVQRLCAEEGIHYHFVHSRRRHQLVFGTIPWEAGFTAPASAPRPCIAPLQRGWIVGRDGEPARTDASGRLHVRLEWDWQHPEGPDAGCWLHLAAGLDVECRGGMSVIVSFCADDKRPPQISGCLSALADDGCHRRDQAPADNVEMHLDWQAITGPDRRLQLANGTRIELAEGSTLIVDAGPSKVQIDDSGLTLSSPRISFANKADGKSSDPHAIE
ncbi:contractile injection system protein, VgrG/Pvc8 family [Pseudomonas syringae]|uniref:contractile injection system protein, VgrG/Pvc8 family n=1 Tax=Pseudomonas syringae TaxID=317 RepID=UPI00200ACBDC|nr:contractile injection system protein, VgrG/Pvc8 family [Pseudomonas syringae]MCK9740557.1 type IV secretion protein Rhs [Pseudomonas syringae pv. syringae]MCK9768508.1 type IV secretion protein Rhs [Pseudomonas syringae pv. syringae]MDU8417234.1 contractile injection system protein, VgrG/Pvc8 family [Pseudomonas syringae]